MLLFMLLGCQTENTSSDETQSENTDLTEDQSTDLEKTPQETTELSKNATEESNKELEDSTLLEDLDTPTEETPTNTIPELPPEILETMTEKEKRVYYAMVFSQNNMPTNKTIYDDEYPLLTPDRDLYTSPSRKTLQESKITEQTFTTEGFSETFLFDSYNSYIYGIVRQKTNNPFAQKGEMIVLANGWKGSIRWHPRVLSQCILEFQIPVQGLTLDPKPLRTKLGYTEHPYDWHTSWLQDTIPSSSQINAQKHPFITFFSTHCSENTNKKRTAKKTDSERTHHILFHGYLSINGVEKGINIKGKVVERTLPKTLEKTTDEKSKTTMDPMSHDYVSQLQISGVFHFNHSDFGMYPYTNIFLGVVNNDLLTIHYNLLDSNE